MMRGLWISGAAAIALTAIGSWSSPATAQTADEAPASTASRARLREDEGVVGVLAPEGDRDWYRFTVRSGTIYTFTLVGEGENALEDPYLSLYDEDGVEVASNDDAPGSLNSRLIYAPQERRQNMFLEARGYDDETIGRYRLAVSTAEAPADEATASTSTRGRIEMGAPVLGDLSFAGDRDWYRVELAAGESYRIRLSSAADSETPLSDPYLSLYDSAGELIGSDDDSGGVLNAYLEHIADQTGFYYIEARGFDQEETGAYALTIDQGDIPNNISTDAVLNAEGDYYSGALEPAGDSDWFRIALTEGQTIRITLDGVEGAGFDDPLLVLYDSEGNEIDRNDDSGASLNSRLEFTAPGEGNYFIGVQGFIEDAFGEYELNILAGEIGDNTNEAEYLEPSVTGINGVLSRDGDHDWYGVDFVEGRPYRIRLVSDDPASALDPYVTLYDADGQEIAADDDGAAGRDAYLTHLSVKGGRHYVGVSSFEDAGSGNYTLYVFDTDVPGSMDTDEFLSAEDGDARAGQIEIPGDVDYFTAELSAGVQYTITLNGAPDRPLSDPYLAIYSDEGVEIAADDDSGPGLNARFRFTPTASGYYYFVASGRRNAIGRYQIEVTR